MPPLKPNLTKLKALIDSHQFELSEFWAKTDEFDLPSMSVISHGIICAEIASLLLSFKTEEFRTANYLKYLSLFAALHDVGKIVPAFQIKCEYWAKKYKISPQNYICQYYGRHSSYSKEIVLKGYKDTQAFENWADVVGSHHGFLSNEVNLNNIASSWEKYRSEFVEYFKKIYGDFPSELNDNKISNEISYLLTGIITFADWLASDVDLFPVKNYTMQEAKLMIKDKLLNSAFSKKILCDFKKLDKTDVFDFPLNSLQLAALDSYKGRGIYLIEAPMGMGKTEASLLLAYKLISDKKASGIYFALPTQLTSNVIYGRLNSFLKEVSIHLSSANLIHSASWLEEIYEGKSDLSSWFNSSKKALLSSFGVGTIDQALMMLLPVKHWHLRYYGLSDKVVILDEIHSYDAYTSTLIKRLVSHLIEMGATVIILSATLTKTQRAKLLNSESTAALDSAKFPSIIYKNKENVYIENIEYNETKEYSLFHIEDDESIFKAIEKAKMGCCVLFICNTVASAQNIYREISIKQSDIEVDILHSRYIKSDRDKIEKYWVNALGKNRENRPMRGSILISTQIVEQSVDIDADCIFTYIAPIDMIFQRLGRCFRHNLARHKNAKKPEVYLISPDLKSFDFKDDSKANIDCITKKFGASSYVYDIYILLKTYFVLWDKSEIKLVEDISLFLDKVYEKDDLDLALLKKLKELLAEKIEELELRAKRGIEAKSNPISDEIARTRFSDYESKDCVFYRLNELGEIIFLDGDSLEIPDRFSREFLKKIFINSIKVASYLVDINQCSKIDKLLIYKEYSFIELNEKGECFYKDKVITYSKKMGLCISSKEENSDDKSSTMKDFERFYKESEDYE